MAGLYQYFIFGLGVDRLLAAYGGVRRGGQKIDADCRIAH